MNGTRVLNEFCTVVSEVLLSVNNPLCTLKKTSALTDDEASKPFKRLFKDPLLNLGVLSR